LTEKFHGVPHFFYNATIYLLLCIDVKLGLSISGKNINRRESFSDITAEEYIRTQTKQYRELHKEESLRR
jgi:hypothetical protein